MVGSHLPFWRINADMLGGGGVHPIAYRYIADPFLARRHCGKILLQQIRGYWQPMLGVRGGFEFLRRFSSKSLAPLAIRDCFAIVHFARIGQV